MCSAPGCQKATPTPGTTYCGMHWKRLRRTGSLDRPPQDVESRLMRRLVEDAEGCWISTSSLDTDGYAIHSVGHHKSVRAHRWMYEHMIGEIPDGYMLDHLCHTNSDCPGGKCKHRACVNPWHLEPVTPRENTERRKRENERDESTGRFIAGKAA